MALIIRIFRYCFDFDCLPACHLGGLKEKHGQKRLLLIHWQEKSIMYQSFFFLLKKMVGTSAFNKDTPPIKSVGKIKFPSQ